MQADRPTTYWDYIRVDQLLSLQSGLEADDSGLANEEVLFITVHQVFELWFKLVLREMRAARDLFEGYVVPEQELSGATERLRRVSTILRTAVQHFDVVETLGTRDYLEFRTKLMPASGFQSAQMRQIEILFGLAEDERIPLGTAGSHLQALKGPGGTESGALRAVLDTMADTPTLKQAVESWLLRTPIDGVAHDAPGAEAALERFLTGFLSAHEAELGLARQHAKRVMSAEDAAGLDRLYDRELDGIRAFLNPTEEQGGRRTARVRAAMLFIETYRELPLLAWPREILSALIEVEQAFVMFRQRHARMVERVIGRRVGTGGSAGVEYLDKTATEYRIFRDLWAIRTMLVRPQAAPPLADPGFYGFAQDGV